MNVYDGEFINDGLAYLDEDQANALRHVTLRKGDVLLNITGASVARVCRLPPEFEGGRVNQHVSIIRPDPKKLDPHFLAHLLRAPEAKSRLLRVAGAGATREAITKGQIEEFKIPLPPLAEQRRIAAILDKADSLRRKRKRALDLLGGLTKSIYINMFGDPIENDMEWPVEQLGKLVINDSAKRVPVKSSDRQDRSGQYPYYGASGIIDYVDDFLFSGRRLLIAEDGANLLSRSTPVAFFAEGKFWVNNHAHVLAENPKCKLTYLRSFIEAIDLSPYVTGSAQPKLNRANMDKIPIPTPPLKLQKQFEERVDFAATLTSRCQFSLLNAEHLFSALQHRAFSGQL